MSTSRRARFRPGPVTRSVSALRIRPVSRTLAAQRQGQVRHQPGEPPEAANLDGPTATRLAPTPPWRAADLLQRIVDYVLGEATSSSSTWLWLPDMANAHQVAQRRHLRRASSTRRRSPGVVPCRTLMAGTSIVTLQAAAREPACSAIPVRDLLISASIRIMFMCMLHCLCRIGRPSGIVQQFRDAVPPGGSLALSHMTETRPPEADRLSG